MHPYYEKNAEKLRKQMDQFLRLIRPELQEDLGLPYPEILQACWEFYRTRLLEAFPYIGGDKSSGTRNLTGAYVFVALGEVARPRGMSLERWGWLTTLCYQRYFEQMPRLLRKAPRLLLRMPGLVNRMLRKKDRANAENAKENPMSFRTETQTPTGEYPVIYHTVQCPLAAFARQEGYECYMPYLCNLDYVTFQVFGIPFYREKTRAAGDSCCDFKFRPGAPVVPAWPCHSLTPGDPLK